MKLALALLLCSCISASMQQHQASMYDFWSYMPSVSSWRMPNYYNPVNYFSDYFQGPHQQQQPHFSHPQQDFHDHFNVNSIILQLIQNRHPFLLTFFSNKMFNRDILQSTNKLMASYRKAELQAEMNSWPKSVHLNLALCSNCWDSIIWPITSSIL